MTREEERLWPPHPPALPSDTGSSARKVEDVAAYGEAEHGNNPWRLCSLPGHRRAARHRLLMGSWPAVDPLAKEPNLVCRLHCQGTELLPPPRFV
jgi:hypothetical protein